MTNPNMAIVPQAGYLYPPAYKRNDSPIRAHNLAHNEPSASAPIQSYPVADEVDLKPTRPPSSGPSTHTSILHPLQILPTTASSRKEETGAETRSRSGTPRLTLKLKPQSKPADGSHRSPSVVNGGDRLTTEAPTTSRAGRPKVARKKRQADDGAVGDELDYMIFGQNPIHQTGAETEGEVQPSPRIRFTKKRKIETSDKNGSPSYPTFLPDYLQYIIPFDMDNIDPDIQSVFNSMSAEPTTHTCLPNLEDSHDDAHVRPWTARNLTLFYLYCHHRGHLDWCDLTADTWIHAFHAANENKNGKPRLWLPHNSQWVDRARPKHQHYIDFYLPSLADDVTRCDVALVNTLYTSVSEDQGSIKLLLADAMALRGSELEDVMCKTKDQWHPDFVHNVMCTSLRMVRRKLTLKVEEKTEGAWCKRYHMHGVKGTRCYREKAREELDRRETVRAKESGGSARDQGKKVNFADEVEDGDEDDDGTSEEE